jgi:hypothetical protein
MAWTERKREIARRRSVEVERRLLRYYADKQEHEKDNPDGSFAMTMWILGYESAKRQIRSGK